MNKRIYLLLVGIIALIVIILLQLSVGGRSSVDTSTDNDQAVPEQSFQQIITNLDDREIEKAVQSQFEIFLTETAGTDRWGDFEVNNIDVPRTIGLQALDVQITPSIEPLLDQFWGIYACESPAVQPTFVLQTQFKFIPEYTNLFDDKRSFMRSWEPTILRDVQSVLFPQTYYSTTSLEGPFFFNPRYEFWEVRQATVSTNYPESSEIAYMFLGDILLISNDAECMVELIEVLHAPG